MNERTTATARVLIGALVAVAGCGKQHARSLTELELHPTELQGVTIDLPAGKVMTDRTDRYQGKHSVNARVDGALAANVALSWNRGAAVTEATARARAEVSVDYAAKEKKLDDAGITGTHTVRAGGQPVFVVVAHMGEFNSVTAMWHCPGDDRNFSLQVLAKRSSDQVVGLGDRIAGSVECHIQDAPPPAHPASIVGFDGDLTVGMKAVSDGFAYVTPDAQVMLAQKVEKGTAAAFAKRPEILANGVSGAKSLGVELHYDPQSVPVDGAAGHLTAYTGRLDTGGQPLLVVTAGISCFGTDVMLYAMKPGDSDPLAALPLVRATRCPKPGDSQPGDAAPIAEAICRDGQVAACASMSNTIAPEAQLKGWLAEACKAGKKQACLNDEP